VLPGRPAAAPEEQRPEREADVRAAWLERGGLRFGYDARGSVTAIYQPEVAVQDGARSGVEQQYGIGGGVGVRAEVVYLKLPDPSMSGGFWPGFRLGFGLDGHVVYSRKPFGYKGADVRYDEMMLFYPVGSLHAGFYLAFGSFRGPTIWRGAVLGLSYAPAYIGQLQIDNTHFEGAFNPMGAEVSVDIARIDVSARAASNAQIRLFVYALPPVDRRLPWLISAGIGGAQL
jgi:hypothetical protein